jgi:hypothetical protein
MPPIAVTDLSRLARVAIVGNFQEFGSENLRLYFYDGSFDKSFAAPSLGPEAQFGAIQQTASGFEALVGYQGDQGWNEIAGRWDPSSGIVEGLHRTY